MTHKKRLSKKQIGILWMTIPFLGLILTLFLFSLTGGLLSLLLSSGASNGGGLLQGAGFALGILGVVSLVGMVIGIPVGLYFFSRVESREVSNLGRHVAYDGLSHEQVAYIAGWSWSAFFMHWFWTLCNRGVRFWTLGFFAPIIQQYMWIKVAMHGRRMIWESGKWHSFKQFRKRQRILAWVAWVFVVLSIVLFSYLFAQFPKMIMRAVLPPQITADYEADPYEFQRNFAMDQMSLDAVNASDPLCQDIEDVDEDGLIDRYEEELGADPKLLDTDGDGFADKEELESGYDPGGPGELTRNQELYYGVHKSRAERCL